MVVVTAVVKDERCGEFLDALLDGGDEVGKCEAVLGEGLADILLVQDVGYQGHSNIWLRQLRQPLRLLPSRYLHQVT